MTRSSWLAIAIVSLLARLRMRAIFAVISLPFLIVGAVAVGIGRAAIGASPSLFLIPAVLMLALWVLAGAAMRCVLDDDAEPRSVARLTLMTRLRRAIDRGEFIVHYQPTVDLGTGAVVGVEALLRWQDPQRGMVAPAEFVQVAEETGLILPIGAWMLDEVCRQAVEWERSGIELDVAFNLSARQLWQPELLANLLQCVERSGVRPDRMIVEVTETSALRDPAGAASLFAEMTERGLRVAIDDFGVGLSSLSRLREIPADVLKIDRSFVAELRRCTSGAVIVQTIIQLAHHLGLRPHAEGIEHEYERGFLLENGCTIGQGFLFCDPRPAAEIPDLYLRSQARGTQPITAARVAAATTPVGAGLP